MTEAGPRSRTLATFRSLTPEVVEQARQRSLKPLEADELRAAALRAGAPVAPSTAERAARELLGELSRGRRPAAVTSRLLAGALGEQGPELSHNARAMVDWMAATPEQRGTTLLDLLVLGDALPRRRRGPASKFPPIHASAA